MDKGKVPNDLKLAKVIPQHKADDPNLFTNYRPISILPFYSKIFDKLIYKRIFSQLDLNNMFYTHQYGFRKKSLFLHGTVPAGKQNHYNTRLQ